MESILQVCQEIPPSQPDHHQLENTIQSLGSRIVPSNQSCRLAVTPITDRQHGSRGGGMSHLLVQVEEKPDNNNVSVAKETTVALPRKALGAPGGDHQIFGTVG